MCVKKNGRATEQSTSRAKLYMALYSKQSWEPLSFYSSSAPGSCGAPPLQSTCFGGSWPRPSECFASSSCPAHGRGLLSASQAQAARLWVWDEYYVGRVQRPGSFLSAMIVDIISRKLPMASMLFTSYVFLILLIFSQMDILTRISLFGAWFCISASFTIVYIYAGVRSVLSHILHCYLHIVVFFVPLF
ncbi:hypothetical protein DAI22_02g177050 [Oryza sativa Japonica Group]|nr:hypothetical protein DAI22_02g177050 [Oryza sativa Japonica Group]